VNELSAATHLSFGRGRHVGVARRAHDVLYASYRHPRHFRYSGERRRAVVGEVAVDLPRPSEVVRTLDEHGRRPERLESHDEVGEMELRLEV